MAHTLLHICILSLAFLSISLSDAGGICRFQSCTEDAPCCAEGFCDSNTMHCIPGICEPANSYTPSSCWNVPHCVSYSVEQIAKEDTLTQIANYYGDVSHAKWISMLNPSNAKFDNEDLALDLVKQSNNKGFDATVMSTRWMQFGTVTAVIKSGSASGGVVSSFFIRNNEIGDEIAFESVGTDKSTFQSNYDWHTTLSDHRNMVKSPSLSDVTENFHEYKIIWGPDELQWAIDGNIFRTVSRTDTWDSGTNTYKYPTSESQVGFKIWDGGSEPSASEWSGGSIQWEKGPFRMSVKSFKIDCFYQGNETTYVPPHRS